MKTKRYSFSLIEVVIAMTMLVMLASVLFSYYRRSALVNIEIEQVKKNTLERHFLLQRLTGVISNITQDESSFETIQSPEASGLVLSFSIDNQLDQNPDLSGVVDAAIYMNKERGLILTLWDHKEQPYHTLLLSKIEKIQWSFFDPKSKTWLNQWSRKMYMPEIAKLTVFFPKQKEAVEFPFFPSSQRCKINYQSQEKE